MYRVLIPVDDNEERAEMQMRAIEKLPETVEPIEAHLLYVYEEIDTPADEGGTVYIDEINESLDELRDLPATVDSVRESLENRDFAVTLHETVGEPAGSILSMVDELDVDTVLMGVRDRSPVGKVVFGSVSQKVIMGSDVPVIVAR